ncbi:hypothetical protein H6G54_24405 [Anabaena cylindrica FACHB-243]|uniref:Uncharacterized protein n=1 Tax=Anabaena cylindrica (strain ATCC 27899 / PCC 7122) TaxID=272123 RepID=K9ZFH1_ANACC|nr:MULTISPECIES: hypothetical protein [Anabaena]AFZ57968.1 hypothetical protein Anacy_2523 [Anabaena cylindrica PCC 7122]MBD2420785.1 hypothetical protein [Anabaena cylindrica FACHB-243]MBY5282700.1 hypothetical protein [Anabaena sp. CCAP 1446/1C]MBY5307126.1 hypothetical protein [Anabaena sp. CCAP 1446/1C]MCM2408195.1 hypothetical protein [Anabaena sp. CCAP 1446/1C]
MDIYKYAQSIGTVCSGLLISLPIISHTVMAQEITPNVNPCPKIFYEEPHNNRVLVPQGCPPNTLTSRFMEQGLMPATPPNERSLGVGGESPSVLNPNPSIFNESPSRRSVQPGSTLPEQPAVQTPPPDSRLQPPAAEQRQEPSARIALVNDKANIVLINDTGANVTYQVIGDTEPRRLAGKSRTNLRGLSTPITVTFQREDRGLLMVTPKTTQETGTLEVTLKETTDVNQDKSAMRIQANGSVFLN